MGIYECSTPIFLQVSLLLAFCMCCWPTKWHSHLIRHNVSPMPPPLFMHRPPGTSTRPAGHAGSWARRQPRACWPRPRRVSAPRCVPTAGAQRGGRGASLLPVQPEREGDPDLTARPLQSGPGTECQVGREAQGSGKTHADAVTVRAHTKQFLIQKKGNNLNVQLKDNIK